jgi:predicted transcriptional regulator
MKIPEIFVAKVRDYILNPRNDRLKMVLLELVNDLEAEDIDRDAMRWMIDQIESGEIGMNYLFEEE